jgi:hypothetical protein
MLIDTLALGNKLKLPANWLYIASNHLKHSQVKPTGSYTDNNDDYELRGASRLEERLMTRTKHVPFAATWFRKQ